MDNRIKEKNAALDEIENDNTPIVESEQPKEDRDAIETPEEDVLADRDDESAEPIDEEALDAEERQGKLPEKDITPELSVDYQERYKESTREAQLLHERNKQLTDAFTKIEDVKEPTQEDLARYVKADGVEWEDLTMFERAMVKKNYVSEQKLQAVHSAVKDVRNIDEWAGKVDGFLEENEGKQTNKALIGRESEFRSFAMKQTHRGLPIELLTSAFLHDAPSKPKRTGSLFNTNQGGEREKAPSTNVDDADKAATLRKSDPREYARQIRAGKIKLEV